MDTVDSGQDADDHMEDTSPHAAADVPSAEPAPIFRDGAHTVLTGSGYTSHSTVGHHDLIEQPNKES